MAKTRVLPIILAAMLSVCANTAVFPATAYAAEPAVEADARKAEKQFEDEDQQETEDNQETEDHQEAEGQPETGDQLETGDQQKTEDQPIEVAETAEQPVTAGSGTAASPKTADQSQWILWMAIMELAVISLATLVIARRNEVLRNYRNGE